MVALSLLIMPARDRPADHHATPPSAPDLGASSQDSTEGGGGNSGTDAPGGRASEDAGVEEDVRPAEEGTVKLPEVSVKDFGAAGDGVQDDTGAIQAANDAVASQGGGRVFFPPGVYLVSDVEQDSYVELYGPREAVLRRPHGVSGRSVVDGRLFKTEGSIAAGSRTLSVDDPSGIRPGAVVAIRGAGGEDSAQVTALALPASPADSVLFLRDISGLRRDSGHLFAGNEIISYSGILGDKLLNVRRGLYGTQAASHTADTRVAQALRHYALVESIDGSQVTLDGAAQVAVRGAAVDAGSIGMKVTGLTLDGSRGSRASTDLPVVLRYRLARSVIISDCEIRNGDHAGVFLDSGTTDSSVVDNLFVNNGGLPPGRLGSTIKLFRATSRNVIRDNVLKGASRDGIHIDDRTTMASEWDGPPRWNRVERNFIDIPEMGGNVAIAVSGGSDNLVAENHVRGTYFGIRLNTTNQGTRPSWATGNLVERNRLTNHNSGLWVSGSHNQLVGNVVSGARKPIADQGSGNRFEGNTVD